MNTTNKIHLSMTVGSVIGMFCAGTALADFNDAVVVRYSVQATEYDGTPVSVMVEDLYLLTDDPKDVDLNIYDLDLVRGARVPYFQSSPAPTCAKIGPGHAPVIAQPIPKITPPMT